MQIKLSKANEKWIVKAAGKFSTTPTSIGNQLIAENIEKREVAIIGRKQLEREMKLQPWYVPWKGKKKP